MTRHAIGTGPGSLGRAGRRGFTLVELMLAMSVAAILVGAVAAALFVAGQALPNRQTPAQAALAAATAVNELADDLALATSFSERTATAMTWVVPDRNGDEAPESIRYAWDGVSGGKLTRAVNGAAPQVVLVNVGTLALAFDVTSQVTQTTTISEVSSGEVLLNSFEAFSGVSFSSTTRSISPTGWSGAWFPVSIPRGAFDVQITRVHVRLQAGSYLLPASVTMSIHLAGTTTPPSPAAAVGSPDSVATFGLLTALTATDFRFSDAFIPSTETQLFFVMKASATDAARTAILVADAPSPPYDRAAVWSNNSGATWLPSKTTWDYYELPASVYGSYKTRARQSTPLTRYFVRAVNIRLETGGGAARPVVVGVELHNHPEVAAP
ncbi:MAG: type II secretion system protein J [Phycisphaerae bacterium]